MTVRRITVPLRPWSLNEHHDRQAGMIRHGKVKQWKRAAGLLWNASRSQGPLPPPPWVLVARTTYTVRRFDVLNDADSIKAIIDGIKEAGGVPNDSPRYIAAAILLPPRLGNRDRVDVALFGSDEVDRFLAAVSHTLDNAGP